MPKKFSKGYGDWIDREAIAKVDRDDRTTPTDVWSVFEIGRRFTILRQASARDVADAFKQRAPKTAAGSAYYWARLDGCEDHYPAMILKDDVDWCPYQRFVRGTGKGHRSWHDGSKGSWEDTPRPRPAPQEGAAQGAQGAAARPRPASQEGAGSKRPAADNTDDVPVSKPSKASKAPDPPNVDAGVIDVLRRINGVNPVCDGQRPRCPGQGECAVCRQNVRDMLGVVRGAEVGAIKKAYHNLVRMLHPDKCNLQGAQEAVQKVIAHYGNGVPKNV